MQQRQDIQDLTKVLAFGTLEAVRGGLLDEHLQLLGGAIKVRQRQVARQEVTGTGSSGRNSG